ncbi:MAG: Gfo/Idh/MocA family oxidoreductase [Nitrospinae bacterium]|nr:Gfo/Idh/MocA family oxidoreductase [Nitrospinota bacterium]
MADRINLALIGAGYWGKNLARNFYQLNALKIVCDPSQEVLASKRQKYPDVETSVSFSDTLLCPDIDAVVIATPAVMHYSMVKESLLAGKHVFVEKPLAMTEKEGAELVALAREKGKTLFVGHILQYHPAIGALKDMLRKGELGKIHYIYSNRLNLGKIRREENILWSFAPHDISVILSLVNEEPSSVKVVGSNILHPHIADTTLTHLQFPCGVAAHIFVSWLHPFKEQKLVVVGDRKMVVFDDAAPREKKLVVYPHNILWRSGLPVPEKKEGVPVDLSPVWEEPLLVECRSFLDAIRGKPCLTDGEEGLRVLRVLQRAQSGMDGKADVPSPSRDYFVHETSVVDPDCLIGKGTKIWHFSHILKGTKIGEKANIGQNVVIGPNGIVGNNVKIQNNVSAYEGVVLEDDVFCGPSCVFTNVVNPRSAIPRKNEYKTTLVRKGATIGANATILCGITIGRHAFVGAGAVVTKDVPDHGLVYGNPATLQGWMCECGCRLDENKKCGACGKTFALP